MIFYFDENFTHRIPTALNELEKIDGLYQVKSTEIEFGKGISDEELIPAIGKFEKGILITKDKKIAKVKAQFTLLKEHNVPTFFVSLANANHWDQIDLIFRKWRRIRELSDQKLRNSSFFSFRVKSRSDPEEMNLH